VFRRKKTIVETDIVVVSFLLYKLAMHACCLFSANCSCDKNIFANYIIGGLVIKA
jgi:hypothetical protein